MQRHTSGSILWLCRRDIATDVFRVFSDEFSRKAGLSLLHDSHLIHRHEKLFVEKVAHFASRLKAGSNFGVQTSDDFAFLARVVKEIFDEVMEKTNAFYWTVRNTHCCTKLHV